MTLEFSPNAELDQVLKQKKYKGWKSRKKRKNNYRSWKV